MRCILAGSREITDARVLAAALEACPWTDQITTVLESGEKGIATLARVWAAACRIPVELHAAKWKQHGAPAGVKRDRFMASIADALISIPGEDELAPRMIEEAVRAGIPVFVYETATCEISQAEDVAVRQTRSAGTARSDGLPSPHQLIEAAS